MLCVKDLPYAHATDGTRKALDTTCRKQSKAALHLEFTVKEISGSQIRSRIQT